MKRPLAVLILALICITSAALAAPPATITYQGYLTGSNNVPLNAPVAMTLALYAAPTGGTALWSEHQTTVSVVNGVYSVLMGSVTPIGLPFDTVYYLGVAVGSDPEMTPRQELASVPYAFRAMGADKLNQVCADGEMLKYSTASSSWSCAVAAGTQGLPGANGTNGTNGTNGNNGLDGKTVLNGAGTPVATGAAGAIGDFYIDTTNNKIYGPKTGASWNGIVGVALVGPQGIPGVDGLQGPAGTTNASLINTGTLAMANGGTGATNAATARSNFGLATVASSGSYIDLLNRPTMGTAAALDWGTGAGNLVRLDVTTGKLPWADGSLLFNVNLGSGVGGNTKGGDTALDVNTTGLANSAFGYHALASNTAGSRNSVIGYYAMASNSLGLDNVAVGVNALNMNTSASTNVAVGNFALSGQSYANGGVPYYSANTAIGDSSLSSNQPISDITGMYNTALGAGSLTNNTTGSHNIGIGYYAGNSLLTGNYNIDIGSEGTYDEARTIRIGDYHQNRTFITGIRGAGTLTDTETVVIDTNGQLSSVTSSAATVASVAVGGGTTGLTTSGGPITSSGTITLGGTLAVANGGTGATNAATARSNLGLATVASSGSYSDLLNRPTMGTAAALDWGTGAGNLVRLDVTTGKLPWADGSLLFNVKLGSVGGWNTKGGDTALNINNTGQANSAFGYHALASNTSGSNNLAVGYYSMASNSLGQSNVAVGGAALNSNTTASTNVAVGNGALTGQSYANGGVLYDSNNTAIGDSSLMSNQPISNSTGIDNTALGAGSLINNTTGSHNIGIGYFAGDSLMTGNYNIDIGSEGTYDEASTTRIGDYHQNRTFISGISGVPIAGGSTVLIDSNGQLGSIASSIRYKEDVNDMGDSTSRLFGLRPVTFRYKTQPATVHFGLIAEEVDQVMPELVVRGNDGQIETVAYHELTPMLLNELQKLKAENTDLKARLLKIEKALGL